MKRLGIGYGSLKTIRMSTIQTVETILQLAAALNRGGKLDVAVLATHSVQYAETTAIQTGHQIVSARIDTAKAWQHRTVGDVMTHYERNDPDLVKKHDALLTKYGFTRTDKLMMNFDIVLDVSPLQPGQTARPLTGNP